MATNYDDINKTEQIKNILTEAQLAEMVAKGTVPPNEEFFTFDDEEDINLDCLRTKVLYKNLAATYFAAQTLTMDLSAYDFFHITYKTRAYSDRNIIQTSIINKNIDDFLYSFDQDGNRKLRPILATDTGFVFGSDNDAGGGCVPIQIVGFSKQPAMIYTGKELHEGDGISIENGVISQKVISKASHSVQIAGGQSFTGPSYQTVASFTITTKGGRILASYCIPLYTSGNVAYTAVHVDGVNYGQEVRMTGSTPRHLSNTVITPELSPGVHTVQLIVRGQKDSNTLTIPSYETGYLLGAEL